MKFRLTTIAALLGSCLFFYSCQNPSSSIQGSQITTNLEPKTKSTEGEKHSDRVYKVCLTPSRNPELVQKSGEQLIKFLEQETKLSYELVIAENYEQMLKAFDSRDEHIIALMNSFSYIKAHQQYEASAQLRAIRYGKSYYFGQIVANSEQNINTIDDLEGKSLVYTDSLSASGYLFPKAILEQKGVKSGSAAFAGTHDRVIKMVYKGIADAGATYYSEPASDGSIRDARSRLQEEFPDVADKVKIVEVTEPIPNDPVVFSSQISKQARFDISLALIKYLDTDGGKKSLQELYSIEGYVRCSDSDYNGLREVLSL